MQYYSLAPRIVFILHQHQTGQAIDLSLYLRSFQQMDRMESPFSSWTAEFKFQERAMLGRFLASTQDDDWAEVYIQFEGTTGFQLPLQLGPVDNVRINIEVDTLGVERRRLIVAGRGWGKALTDTSVTTLQRLTESGWIGTIMTPKKAMEFDMELLNAFQSQPTLGLQKVLSFLLDAQWRLPPSLRQSVGGFASDYLHAAVRTGGVGLEVDGVVWRGLSMMGGVRGTIWQMLSAFASDPALVELWPTYELWVKNNNEEPGISNPAKLRPFLCYRKRPFAQSAIAADGWNSLAKYSIDPSQICKLDLGKSGLDRFNVELVAPEVAEGDLESAVLAQNNGLPLRNLDSIAIHGTRLWVPRDNLSNPGEKDFLNTRTRRLSDFVWAAYLPVPAWLNGTIETKAAALPPTVVGSRLAITKTETDEEIIEFYCEGMDSQFVIDARGTANWTQSYLVTRGQGQVPSLEA